MDSGKSGYDYIIVGAGTAGCVLAARLSEDESTRVLLLEAGAREPLPNMSTPREWPALLESTASWGDSSVTLPATGTSIPLPRGRGLGGSSSINGMVFTRGHRSSYDVWPEQGAAGWGFDDLLPYFRRSESARGRDPGLRGMDGPLQVGPLVRHNPLAKAWIAAGIETGVPSADDVNDGLTTGIGWSDFTIVDGARQSAADAYLRPVMGRPNLDVVADAPATRVRVSGSRCTGVEYATGGVSTAADCTGEVVLTAGAIGSAQLLLLSGIGPAAHLGEVGVDVVLDLPGVGANLQDHPMSSVVYAARKPVPVIPGAPLDDALAVINTDPEPASPDVQLHLVVAPYRASGLDGPAGDYSILFSTMHPYSRGTVRLADARADTPPLIDPNYYGDQRDVATMTTALGLARRLGEADALADWRGGEVSPGPGTPTEDPEAARGYLDKDLLCYFHYCGTCRIGVDDLAVVDPELRLHGITGLRVADAGTFPSLPSANTNATAYAVAERAATLLTGLGRATP